MIANLKNFDCETSVSKEMYREVYGVDSDVKMKQVNITIY